MWDEVAAATWLDESLVTRFDDYFIDVNLHHGASYGDMLSWDPGHEPGQGERRARIQKHLDDARFYEAFVALCSVQP
jgi:inosine-uridine nucleoside N-ribohydrolase